MNLIIMSDFAEYLSLRDVMDLWGLSNEFDIIPFLKNNAHLVMLFKPQFEVGKNKVGKGGIVRDTKIIQDSLEDFFNFLKAQSLAIKGTTKSPRQSAGKNQEIFIHAHITSHE